MNIVNRYPSVAKTTTVQNNVPPRITISQGTVMALNTDTGRLEIRGERISDLRSTGVAEAIVNARHSHVNSLIAERDITVTRIDELLQRIILLEYNNDRLLRDHRLELEERDRRIADLNDRLNIAQDQINELMIRGR